MIPKSSFFGRWLQYDTISWPHQPRSPAAITDCLTPTMSCRKLQVGFSENAAEIWLAVLLMCPDSSVFLPTLKRSKFEWFGGTSWYLYLRTHSQIWVPSNPIKPSWFNLMKPKKLSHNYPRYVLVISHSIPIGYMGGFPKLRIPSYDGFQY